MKLLLLMMLLPTVAFAAVDTAAKRNAAIAIGGPGRTLPIPDNAIDSTDRHHMTGSYIGPATTPTPTPPNAVEPTRVNTVQTWIRKKGNRR